MPSGQRGRPQSIDRGSDAVVDRPYIALVGGNQARPSTPEELLIERYFDAFNRHDLEGVLACFDADIVLVSPDGSRVVGIDAARQRYAEELTAMPDAHCELRRATGHDGHGVAESVFRATVGGRPVEAVGAEVMELAGDVITEIRDYHQMVP
jgi:ketosteroid isomerase-like protein